MKKEKNKQKGISTGSKVFLITIGVMLVILILLATIPFPYTAVEARISNVPYEAKETYTESEPYEDCNNEEYSYSRVNSYLNSECVSSHCTDWNIWKTKCLNRECDRYRFSCSATYRNNEDKDGQFTFSAYFQTDVGNKINKDKVVYTIPARMTKNVIFTHEASDKYDVNSCRVNLDKAPTEVNCKTRVRDVTKTRTITKYKEEVNEVPVRKSATVFEFLKGVDFYYEVRI